jgi:hypothetical protein
LHLPQFTADSSLYVSGRHYRTGEYRWQDAGAPLAPRTDLVVTSQGNCCGGDEDSDGCCLPGWFCMVDSDNNFKGCCPDTPCFDAGGDSACCGVEEVCCGEKTCIRQSTDPCATCGESCSDTQICCSPKGKKPYCTYASSDAKNCGSCFNACSGADVCLDGLCVPAKYICYSSIYGPQYCPPPWVCSTDRCCIPTISDATCNRLTDCCSNFCNEDHQCDCFGHGDQAYYGPQSCCEGLQDSNGICCSPGQTGCAGSDAYGCCTPGHTCCNGKCCTADQICFNGSCLGIVRPGSGFGGISPGG